MSNKPMLRMKKVNLYVNADNEEGYEEVTFLVRRVQFHQFPVLLAEVYTIYYIVSQNEKLMALFKQVFNDEEGIDEEVLANFTPEELKQIRAEKRAKSEVQFLKGLLGSFEVLLKHLPAKAGDLLEAMVNIDEELLAQQDYEGVLGLYDAFLKVNDLAAMLERGKLSWADTQEYVKALQKEQNLESSKAALKAQLQ